MCNFLLPRNTVAGLTKKEKKDFRRTKQFERRSASGNVSAFSRIQETADRSVYDISLNLEIYIIIGKMIFLLGRNLVRFNVI